MIIILNKERYGEVQIVLISTGTYSYKCTKDNERRTDDQSCVNLDYRIKTNMHSY